MNVVPRSSNSRENNWSQKNLVELDSLQSIFQQAQVFFCKEQMAAAVIELN